MSKLPYYTSNTLIEAVKRNISFPIAQVTFSNDDLLRFADEEMFLEQVPSILQFHEEYFVFNQIVPLAANQSKYPIPNRAIGMKLRDLFYRDEQGQLSEMSRINPDDKSFMQTRGNSFSTPKYYYLENNNVVISPTTEYNPTPIGSLQFSYYLRPNSLVTDDRACVIQSLSRAITISNLTLVAGDQITFETASGITTIVANTDFVIGVNDATTANNLVTYISTLTGSQFSATVNSNIVTILHTERNTKFTTTNTSAFSIQSTITLNTSGVPTDIISGSLVDILQTEGGHTTLAIDVKLGTNSVSLTSLTLTDAQLPLDFTIGDYICARYECIIPQIPTDLHMLLGERTSVRVLQALGDKDAAKEGSSKIDRLEFKQGTILDSRVEGSPMKVINRHGLLRSARVGFGRTTT